MLIGGAEVDLNTVLVVIGWLIGGVVVVVGVRVQITHLTAELALLRQTLIVITGRIDTTEKNVSYLQGLNDGRRERLEEGQ